jgi:maltokinase
MRRRTRGARAPDKDAAGGPAVGVADLLDLLSAWLPGQRWFAAGPDNAARATVYRRVTLLVTDTVAAELVLISVPTGTRDVIYQAVVGWRTAIPERLEHAFIGHAGPVACYDALHDEEVTGLLLRALTDGSGIGPIASTGAAAGDIATDALHGLALTSEQSNTSIVFGNSLILKFFRRIEPGINPDAEMAAALADRPYTAGYVGELRIDLDGVPTTLALATRFIPNSADAWSTATASVRDLLAEGDLHADEVGGDFGSEAFRLGAVIAHMHRDLADVFGQSPTPEGDVDALLAAIEHDAAALQGRLPEIADLMPDVRRTCAALARDLAGVRAFDQRIHGDLHLGQVLRTVDGWVVIDFEGEPAVPLARRREPKSRFKDLAGMLRSFDYAARYPLYMSTVDAQRSYRSDEWLARNGSAFLDGYADAYGTDPRDEPALLTAHELAKAVYEVDYELRHRPSWVRIPLEAVRSLTAQE